MYCLSSRQQAQILCVDGWFLIPRSQWWLEQLPTGLALLGWECLGCNSCPELGEWGAHIPPTLVAGSAIFTEGFWNPSCYLWPCWLHFCCSLTEGWLWAVWHGGVARVPWWSVEWSGRTGGTTAAWGKTQLQAGPGRAEPGGTSGQTTWAKESILPCI